MKESIDLIIFGALGIALIILGIVNYRRDNREPVWYRVEFYTENQKISHYEKKPDYGAFISTEKEPYSVSVRKRQHHEEHGSYTDFYMWIEVEAKNSDEAMKIVEEEIRGEKVEAFYAVPTSLLWGSEAYNAPIKVETDMEDLPGK